jgi:hypothetical protein
LTIFNRALDAGINFFDTANVYTKGASETIVGKALPASGKRDDLILATKVTNATGPGVNDKGYSRWHVIRECERSLIASRSITWTSITCIEWTSTPRSTNRCAPWTTWYGRAKIPLPRPCSKFPPSLMTESLMRCSAQRLGEVRVRPVALQHRRPIIRERAALDLSALGRRRGAVGAGGAGAFQWQVRGG